MNKKIKNNFSKRFRNEFGHIAHIGVVCDQITLDNLESFIISEIEDEIIKARIDEITRLVKLSQTKNITIEYMAKRCRQLKENK